MKNVKKHFISLILVAALVTACSSSMGGLGPTMDLVNSLTKLGVTPDQAIGGAGALLNLAQGQLSAENFTKVAEAIPNLNTLMEQAKGLGAFTGQLTDMTGVNTAFEKLGMDKSKVNQFIPEITGFASKNGGEEVGNLLSGVWK
jgi:hypothetical protein